MNRTLLGALLGAVLVAALGLLAVAGASLSSTERDAASENAAYEISQLREEVDALRGAIDELAEVARESQTSQQNLLDRLTPVSTVSAATGATPTSSTAMSKADLKEFVAVILDQQRELRDEAREEQRDEFRRRIEERQQELEAMKEGPYDRFNLKVNSLGKVLGLEESQKSAYYELALAYNAKLKDKTSEVSAANEASETDSDRSGDESRRDRRRGRDSYRRASAELQEEFAAEVAEILTEDQRASFDELSRDARSFASREAVSSSSGRRRSFGFSGRSSRGGPGGGRGGGRRR